MSGPDRILANSMQFEDIQLWRILVAYNHNLFVGQPSFLPVIHPRTCRKEKGFS